MDDGEERMVCRISTATNLKGINELEVEMHGRSVRILLDEDSYWELDNFVKEFE